MSFALWNEVKALQERVKELEARLAAITARLSETQPDKAAPLSLKAQRTR